MYMKEYMNTNVITVNSKTAILEAEKTMSDHKIRRLPVVDNDKLVGILTRRKVREATICPITSLSVWDLNYLLAKTTVKDVMERNLFTVTPDMTLEQAVSKAQERMIGTLLVVDENDKSKLIGIATTTDLYKITTQILGFGQRGVRLHVFEPARTGGCEEVLSVIIEHGVGIHSMFHVTAPRMNKEDCIIHLKTDGATEIIDNLRAKGYEVEVRQS
jgi:acetoin utilization protein AcuB